MIECLHLVGEIGAAAPHGLEAVDDVGEQAIDSLALVADATPQTDVPDLNGSEGHGSSLAKLIDDEDDEALDEPEGE